MKELLAKYGQKMIDATIERFNLSENEAKNLDHLEDDSLEYNYLEDDSMKSLQSEDLEKEPEEPLIKTSSIEDNILDRFDFLEDLSLDTEINFNPNMYSGILV